MSPPRRFKLETPIWSWNVAVFPSGSVGSLAWKLQTTRAVSACMQVFIDKVILTLRDTVHAHTQIVTGYKSHKICDVSNYIYT